MQRRAFAICHARPSSRTCGAVSHVEAARLPLQVPHLPVAVPPPPPSPPPPPPPSLPFASDASRRFSPLENVAAFRYHSRLLHSRAHRGDAAGRCTLSRESFASTARFAWPGPAPTSGITLKLTPATTRTTNNRASSVLFVALSLPTVLEPNSHEQTARSPSSKTGL